MISVRDIKVTGFSRQYYDVFWEIEPTTEDIQEYTFVLERSESEAGPFEAISGELVDRYHVRDNDVYLISSNRTLFYRVRVRHALSGKVEYSDIADRWGKPDLIAQEIVRLETLLFQEFAGGSCFLFPRRTFGQRCPQCWDAVLQKTIDSKCPTCFGTGFSGGYHYPVQFFAQIDEGSLTETVSESDYHQQKMFTFRCPASPELKPLDLFVDFKNRRMRVVSVGGTTRLGVRVRQEVQATLLQPGSIADAVPLKIDHENFRSAGRRNYTNPQNLEAAGVTPEDALDSLLGRFGY